MPGVRFDRFLASTAVFCRARQTAEPQAAHLDAVAGPEERRHHGPGELRQRSQTCRANGNTGAGGKAGGSRSAGRGSAKPRPSTAADASPAGRQNQMNRPTSQPHDARTRRRDPRRNARDRAAAAEARHGDRAAGRRRQRTGNTVETRRHGRAPATANDLARRASGSPGDAAPQPIGTARERRGEPGPGDAAAAATAAADAPIADQLRELANGKFDRVIGSKKDRGAIDAFYASRDYAPIWITDGKANARAQAAIAYLGHVDADGLDPADYPVPNFTALERSGRARGRRDQAHDVDRHLRAPRCDRARALVARQRRHLLRSESAGSGRSSRRDGDGKDVGAALDSLRAAYAGLSRAQGQARRTSAPARPRTARRRFANGPVLKVGMQDERVPQLRDRLGVPGDGGTTYDKALAEAVKKFQQEHDLKATGTLTAATLEALNGRQPDRPTDIDHRQSGTLALDAARSRQDLRHRQSSRLHAARDAQRPSRSG